MTEALVVGAGVGGLAAATLLQRLGYRTTVVERRAEDADAGAGIMIQPNGLAVLAALGVTDELEKAGSEVGQLRLLDERLRVLSELPFPGGSAHGKALVVARSDLYRVLATAARAAGVEVRYDARLTGLQGDPEAPVPEVDGEAMPAPDLLVGADGQGSLVRRFVDPGGRMPVAGRAYVRALVDWSCVEPLTGEYWTRRGIAGIFGCGQDRTYWYCTATAAVEKAFDSGDLPRVRKVVASAHPPLIQAVGALADVDQARIDRVVDVRAEQLYRGATALVGDAAHAMAPNLGQGANSALVDAGVLAAELARRSGRAEALAAYDARRHEAVTKVQLDARRLARVSHLTRGRVVRNRVVRALPRRFTAAGVLRAQQVDVSTFRLELADIPS